MRVGYLNDGLTSRRSRFNFVLFLNLQESNKTHEASAKTSSNTHCGIAIPKYFCLKPLSKNRREEEYPLNNSLFVTGFGATMLMGMTEDVVVVDADDDEKTRQAEILAIFSAASKT